MHVTTTETDNYDMFCSIFQQQQQHFHEQEVRLESEVSLAASTDQKQTVLAFKADFQMMSHLFHIIIIIIISIIITTITTTITTITITIFTLNDTTLQTRITAGLQSATTE